ncbi:hypothetical protein BuS5_03995 (plasmid) [Desulfosarcina sp. BuS5]|uniref:PEP-CTERM sorting domain-containing protein n=1 Tax=Desulfosarcina sp. BuS5 TaxID=933262 RepID=UPI0004838109|nr:PEP-CTERM sorting domain-containing protein [Desulfosarcina sp. BuS5]WDN91023.1 hypothetical protein BuS5_03995 [Desulfosarcina sp. BuS5]
MTDTTLFEFVFHARLPKGHGTVYLQTYKGIENNIFKVTGQNSFTVTNIGLNTFTIADSDKIHYSVGDYVGWTFTNPAIIPFDFGGEEVRWTLQNQMVIGVGSTLTFPTTGPGSPYNRNRIYSISAETSPIPVPATIWLFCSGLLGLGFWRRKNTKNS